MVYETPAQIIFATKHFQNLGVLGITIIFAAWIIPINTAEKRKYHITWQTRINKKPAPLSTSLTTR